MDAAYRRRSMGGSRRTASRTKHAAPGNGTEGDGRRLLQLLVSLALFLLVYVGRGVFPGQLEFWQRAMAADVDFQAAFAEFGRAVSEGEPVQSAFEGLCASVFGGETAEEQGKSDLSASHLPGITPVDSVHYLGGSGVLTGLEGVMTGSGPVSGGLLQDGPETSSAAPESPEPEPPESPEPAPSEPVQPEPDQAQVVTAVAQEYTDDGVKLPSNVSFAYYELGLEQTAVPVMGAVTSSFGYRDHPSSGKNEFHLALDIGAAEGTEIGAFADGTVEYIGESDIFGQYLKIRHDNNVSSFYAHCSKLLVRKGETVSCGQTVALVGQTGDATGPHLHLTIEKDNIRLDPAYYVDLP